MNLASLRIENFRAFEDETINFNEYTCLVGPNGGGKSTALTALNILFRYPIDSVPNLLALDRGFPSQECREADPAHCDLRRSLSASTGRFQELLSTGQAGHNSSSEMEW